MPLMELKRYVDLHNHLQQMPSADQRQKDGIDLGDNQALLLNRSPTFTSYFSLPNRNQQSRKKQQIG